MSSFFHFLASNPYILLFLTVGLAVWIGRQSIGGYGLGMVAAAIIVGCGLSVWASSYGVTLALDNFTKSMFYYLFMYGVGLRVGPSFMNSLGRDGLKFTLLAFVSCILGLGLVVAGARLFDLPPGAAGGMLAGSQTMSAAIGSAEEAINAGVVTLPAGTTPEQATSMIALAYGITYIWGTVGIILITKYLPAWWGVDAKAAARQYEVEHGVASGDTPPLTGWTPGAIRAYRLDNKVWDGATVGTLLSQNPEYRVVNVVRDGTPQHVTDALALKLGDVIALGGRREVMTEKMGLIGPEVSDRTALDIPLDTADILVTNAKILKLTHKELRELPDANQVQVTKLERSGVPIPIGKDTKLQRMDVVTVVGLKDAVSRVGAMFGRVVRPSTATDLLTLAIGMILGFLIGAIQFPAFGASVGLGNAGGLLVSGVIVSSIASRLRFFGNTPNAARNILEDLGLVVFVAIVGINAGNSLLTQLTGTIALKIFIVGFVACSIPPVIVWMIGYYIFKMNPAVLMGGVAGARSHSGPCREAAVEIQSNVPWIGFPVAYAVSGVLLTVFGYFAMVLAQ
ncbi:putative transport protein [Microvirga flocculans]|uniref:Putative transport protein n=1 Tax=Microvirga flocculans TaxID=217168 RepID=A0A7W6N9T1_9HYPH|nr:TrkA C-terminal domain-containing protein [Microvirga flocculans]MBB4042062.1 putative transport protein [Microvirga flocculans]